MHTITRRSFIRQTATGLGGALALAQLPLSLLNAASFYQVPLGFQSWTIREALAKDFAGTLKMMAAQGYQQVEMCSPKGYAKMGFGAFEEMKTADIRATIRDAGLSCPSCHFTYSEFSAENLDDRIRFAKELGLQHMICSAIGLPKNATLNDFLVAADGLNRAGEKIRQAGLQCGYHNHSFEFATLEGRLIYDALLERFDPEYVKMQFQTEVINLGFKAADYFRRHPGRFVSAHLSDWTPEKKQVPVGQGVINWKEFFAAAKGAGVSTYFVEMEPSTFRDSAAFVRKLA